MATLHLPPLLENELSWGPPAGSSITIPGTRTATATRLEKIPKAADWIGVTVSGAHSVKELVELDDFEVAGGNKQKKTVGPMFLKFNNWHTRGRGRGQAGAWSRGGNANRGRGTGRGNAGRGRGRMTSQVVGHATSIVVKDSWEIKHHLTLTSLSKIVDVEPPKEADLAIHGSCNYYDSAMDSIDPFAPVFLKKCKKTFYRVTPLEDEVLRDIVMDLAEKRKRVIVTNDHILSTLMTAPRSIFSWEIRATKADDVIFLDWNTDDPLCNCYTVNETSPNPPYDCENAKDTIMTATSLSQEATSLTKNLSQIVLSDKRARVRLGEHVTKHAESPFAQEGDDPCSVLYRYRSFTLFEGLPEEVVIVVRTELDGAISVKDSEPQYIRTFAVNEVDDKASSYWRANISSCCGMILGNFIKTNACKACRWACMSVLSGAEKVKLGYIVRKDTFQNTSHHILGVETRSIQEFSAQVGFNSRNAWSIFYRFASDLLAMDNGDYMLVKEAGKPVMTWYFFEEDACEAEQESDEGEMTVLTAEEVTDEPDA